MDTMLQHWLPSPSLSAIYVFRPLPPAPDFPTLIMAFLQLLPTPPSTSHQEKRELQAQIKELQAQIKGLQAELEAQTELLARTAAPPLTPKDTLSLDSGLNTSGRFRSASRGSRRSSNRSRAASRVSRSSKASPHNSQEGLSAGDQPPANDTISLDIPVPEPEELDVVAPVGMDEGRITPVLSIQGSLGSVLPEHRMAAMQLMQQWERYQLALEDPQVDQGDKAHGAGEGVEGN